MQTISELPLKYNNVRTEISVQTFNTFNNCYLLMFKNSILLICLVYIVFAVYFLLVYLLFLSMVHEYAYLL